MVKVFYYFLINFILNLKFIKITIFYFIEYLNDLKLIIEFLSMEPEGNVIKNLNTDFLTDVTTDIGTKLQIIVEYEHNFQVFSFYTNNKNEINDKLRNKTDIIIKDTNETITNKLSLNKFKNDLIVFSKKRLICLREMLIFMKCDLCVELFTR